MFGYPDRSFYANEIVRIAGVGTGSVQRELARLSACDLLTVSKVGNQKHYQANSQSPIYGELRSIVLKTFGAMDQLRTAVHDLDGGIELALIYGPSELSPGDDLIALSPDIQMLIVSDLLEYVDVVSAFTDMENRLGRNIHVVLLKPKEFKSLLREQNETVLGMLRGPRVVLTGTLDDYNLASVDKP